MTTLAEKADLITLIYEQSQSPGLRAMSSLLDAMIEEAREKNDSDGPDRVPFNQGQIAAYKELKKLIREGIQIPEQRTVKTY
jgi:hypothetical protein